MKKRIFYYLFLLINILGITVLLSSCSLFNQDDKTEKVMNLSLNPEIEFILDSDNKVISVNALNEDGNHIISISIDEATNESKFENMDAEEAVKLFLEISKENGYLVLGIEDDIKIEVSGKADNLLEKIKTEASTFFEENNFNINVITDSIEDVNIKEEIKKCLKEFSDEDLEEMTTEELIAKLKVSREETKNFYSQELKDAYYNLRAEKINMAELDAILQEIKKLPLISDTLFSVFEANMVLLEEAMTALENLYYENFLAADGPYYKAKEAYVVAKKELLDLRVELSKDGLTDEEKTILDNKELFIEECNQALESLKSTCDKAIVSSREALNQLVITIKAGLEKVKTALSAFGVKLEEIEAIQKEASAEFKDYFENHDCFKNYIGYENAQWSVNVNIE